MDTLQRVACKAVIVKDKKVLILREASTYVEGTNIGRWGLPGGRINPGEPFAEGLLREVREETGLVVKMGEPLFIGEWFPVIKGVKNHIVAIFFICKQVGNQNVVVSEEHDNHEWVRLDDLSKFDLMSSDDEVLKTYFTKVAMR